MSFSLTILGSGSAGNCAYLEAGETRLLMDAGLSGRQIRERLASIGVSMESLTGVLVTHEHGDHVQGLMALRATPVYCNRRTRAAIERETMNGFDWRLFDTGYAFEIGNVLVSNFTVPHDAADPVGFIVHTHAGSVGFLTDLGHATGEIIARLRSVNVLLLEANHDIGLLRENATRPWAIRQRMLGRRGHLSNDAAAKIVERIVSSELRHLYLGHLSRECNRPELAVSAVSKQLRKSGAHHVRLEVATQDVLCQTLSL